MGVRIPNIRSIQQAGMIAAAIMVALATAVGAEELTDKTNPYFAIDASVTAVPGFDACADKSQYADSGKGPTLPLSLLLKALDCAAASHPVEAMAFVNSLEKTLENPSWTGAQARVALEKMRLDARAGNLFLASIDGRWANFLAKEWDGVSLSDEQLIYWDMLPKPMRGVLAAYGGTRSENRDARPTDWKRDGGRDLWIYRGTASSVTVYTFRNGVLISTTKT